MLQSVSTRIKASFCEDRSSASEVGDSFPHSKNCNDIRPAKGHLESATNFSRWGRGLWRREAVTTLYNTVQHHTQFLVCTC